ncbi:MAG: hypothetical protein AUG74_02300 [Bacteroidetes bacterium 13_1_20CM_4_60_6]|nr:MAG: hypothetical protein AUG74_02300 [Bacteroidetes bacterium 13_1_20CM_4_60_6]
MSNQCSPEEVDMLFELMENEENKELKAQLIQSHLNDPNIIGFTDPKVKEVLHQRLHQILLKTDKPENEITMLRSIRIKWVAAAAILLLIAGAGYFLNYKSKPKDVAIVKKSMVTDVSAPSIVRAKLKLDDGSVVYLDSARNGSLAVQGGVKIVKTADGRIAYSGKESKVMYNTLINPRGSKVVNIILSDGTRVWLNAESSLRYPATFVGKERKVEITGEGYFEVAHDSQMPFLVTKDVMQIKVLGTHFNVNTYDNESLIRITLLEGSVNVNNQGRHTVLTPGQQAQMVGVAIKVVSNVDTDEVMAWKNGKFQFGEKADIGMIMRQLSRWYNVDVEYQGTVNQHFWGSLPRDVNVSQVLQKIESTGGVKFKIEGNKVVVMP